MQIKLIFTGLVLKQRQKVTLEWPIAVVTVEPAVKYPFVERHANEASGSDDMRYKAPYKAE